MKAVLGLAFLMLGGFLLYEIVSGNAEAIAKAFNPASNANSTTTQNSTTSSNSNNNAAIPNYTVPSTSSVMTYM